MPLAMTGYEIALLASAVVFIAFALVVALVIPRGRPDFPAGRLGWFVAVCIVLFAVQLGAVLTLAELGEEEEEHAEAAPPTATLPTETTETETTTETTETETTETTETTATTETTETTVAQGDPVAGKEVFLSVAQPSCSGCHTLSDAGSTGPVGPDLDAASPSYDRVVDRVTNGQSGMPSFADTLSEQQIQDVAAYVSSVAGD